MRISLALSALVMLVGCKAETFGGDDPAIDPEALQVVAGTPLPGGRVTISAPWMAGEPGPLTFLIDGATAVAATRDTGGADRFFLDLPDTLPAGTHQLAWRVPSGSIAPIGQVTTGGFTQVRYLEGEFYSPTQTLPGIPGVAGLTCISLPYCTVVPATIDARAGRLTKTTDMTTDFYGVGASYLPGRFLVWHPWSGGVLVRVGTTLGKTNFDSLPVSGYTAYPGHELAPGLYLKDEKYYSVLWGNDPSDLQDLTQSAQSTYRSPQQIAFSPDGRWAVPGHRLSYTGLLIVDRFTRTHHWAPGWMWNARAVFTDDGSLVVYGWRSGTSANGYAFAEYLAHVDPTSGAMLDSVRVGDVDLPYDYPVALAAAPLIVIPGWVSDHLELSIRDPRTLAELAHPRSPSITAQCGPELTASMTFSTVEDPPLRRLYLVGNDCYGGSIPLVTFQLP